MNWFAIIFCVCLMLGGNVNAEDEFDDWGDVDDVQIIDPIKKIYDRQLLG